MIISAQPSAARALPGIGQKALAGMAGVSVSTAQRMEASQGKAMDTNNGADNVGD